MDMKKQIKDVSFHDAFDQDFTCDDFYLFYLFIYFALQYLSFSYGSCYNVKLLIVYFKFF